MEKEALISGTQSSCEPPNQMAHLPARSLGIRRPVQFASTKTDENRHFFEEEFLDAVPLMRRCRRFKPSKRFAVTIRCAPWLQNKVALVATLPCRVPSMVRA